MTYAQIRIGVQAVIIRDAQLLTVVKQYSDGIAYILPGGSQNHGEPLDAAIIRECQEEIGATVTVERLLFVREYIGANHEYARVDQHLHLINVIFECSVPADYIPQSGAEPDQEQIGVEWLPLATLNQYRFYPAALHPYLLDSAQDGRYVGDIN